MNNENYIGRILDGRYEIQSMIGEGGMAVVYKATDHRLNREVAVKIMRPEMAEDEEFRRRFLTEAHAVAKLSNHNIVAIYDVSRTNNVEYLVMEYVDGITLKMYMERRGALGWREALHFSRQIARALKHAHERGIIHRDIKPNNIMLLKDGTIKVADFGIAALENEVIENKGQAIGSIHYIAPEQARGESPDARSDLYSLGVVMYEMLTGDKPYQGSSIGEIAVKHMNARPVPPHELVKDLPEELERITMKAMSADITQRYQTAEEMLNDLEAFVQTQIRPKQEEKLVNPGVVPVRSVSEMSRESYQRRRVRSGRVSFMTGTFGVLLCALALFVFLWNFWLKDVFAPAVRIDMPNFEGSSYESLMSDPELAGLYSFEVIFIVNTDTQPGIVLSQSPEAGRSIMVTSEGIPVTLIVSTGDTLSSVPDVINMDYRTASATLRQSGFYVEIENERSDIYPRNNVMKTYPDVGQPLATGSTVYLTVSCGPEIINISMPNLIGLSEGAAIQQLENSALSYGGSEYVTSDLAAGTVIGQSREAFSDVVEHSKIILRVSTGPVDG
jgi:serine/threonine-protein kinase